MTRSFHSPRRAAFLAPLLAVAVLALPSPSPAQAGLPNAEAASALQQRPSRIAGWAAAPGVARTGTVYDARLRVSGGRRPVLLQRRLDGAWRTVDAGRTDRAGRVVLRWTPSRSEDRVLLRAFAPNTRAARADLTRTQVVKVRPRSTGDGGGAPSAAGGGAGAGAVALPPVLRQVLALVNRARSTARTCGDERMPAVPPVRPDARLTRAADGYARAMARGDFFGHASPDGTDPGDRIDAAGYDWRSYGENIAGGHESAAAVVRGVAESPGHCTNLMGRWADIGLGFASDPSSTYQRYWVQDFATR